MLSKLRLFGWSTITPILNSNLRPKSLAKPFLVQDICKSHFQHAECLAKRYSGINNKYERSLQNTLNIYNSLRHFSATKGFKKDDNKPDDKKEKKRIPKLILLQNPFKWLTTKFDLFVLKRLWDPSFSEKEFKYGTKQAIAVVTQVIQSGELSNLKRFLTKPAHLSLVKELDRNWSVRQRSLVELSRDDIQVSSPRKVYFIKIADKRYCDVDMAFLALKWTKVGHMEILLFAEIFARFHRDYTPEALPEWTIAYFKITRFQPVRRSPD